MCSWGGGDNGCKENGEEMGWRCGPAPCSDGLEVRARSLL